MIWITYKNTYTMGKNPIYFCGYLLGNWKKEKVYFGESMCTTLFSIPLPIVNTKIYRQFVLIYTQLYFMQMGGYP